jgi:hypothetical protein
MGFYKDVENVGLMKFTINLLGDVLVMEKM